MVKSVAQTPTFEHYGASASARPSIAEVMVDITETGNYIIIPPDGGWGWVVVIASFLTFTFIDGLSYCFGLFMDDISREMMVSLTVVSITSSLLTAQVYLFAPIFCAMINRYSFRMVAVIGAIGTSTCVICATYAPNFPVFLLILGFMGGIFMSMSYISSCVVVGFYFERWRALATGISVSGSAAGVIIIPLLLGVLNELTWRQQMRILGGMLTINIMAAMTYKSIAPVKVDDGRRSSIETNKINVLKRITMEQTDYADMESKAPSSEWGSRKLGRFNNLRYPTAAEMHATGGTILLSYAVPAQYGMFQSVNASVISDFNRIDIEDTRISKWKCHLDCNCCHKKLGLQTSKMYITTRPLYRQDIFFHGPIKRLEKYKKAMAESTMPGSSMTNYHMDVTHMAAYQDYLDQQAGPCICCPHAVVRILSTMFDMNLLRTCSFTIFMFSGFFTAAGMFVPYIYVTEMNIAAGLGEGISRNLLSVIGFTNIIGRILCGLISVSPKIQATIVMEVALVISGAAVIIMPFFANVYIQYICGSVFGLTIAVNGALRPIVIVDLYGLEKLTNAFGIALLFQGVACSLGIPTAGLLKDATGSYHALMIFAGGCITLSGLLIFLVKPLVTREKNAEYSKLFPYTVKERDSSTDTPNHSSFKRRWKKFQKREYKSETVSETSN